MVCQKCGKEFSDKVYRLHAGRCNAVQEEKEMQGGHEATKAELIDMAEGLGIDIDKRWSKARIAEAIDQ